MSLEKQRLPKLDPQHRAATAVKRAQQHARRIAVYTGVNQLFNFYPRDFWTVFAHHGRRSALSAPTPGSATMSGATYQQLQDIMKKSQGCPVCAVGLKASRSYVDHITASPLTQAKRRQACPTRDSTLRHMVQILG